MVVLAVNVSGDHSAQRDEARARGDRGEPAPRQHDVDDFGQQHPALADQHAGGGVERDEAVQPPRADGAIPPERSVAIGARVAAGDEAIANTSGERSLGGVGWRNQRAFDYRIAAPASQTGRMRDKAQIEIPITTAAMTPIAQETRSVSAKTTGSSWSRLRLESIITRLIQ